VGIHASGWRSFFERSKNLLKLSAAGPHLSTMHSKDAVS
jgi:hypothetical protein